MQTEYVPFSKKVEEIKSQVKERAFKGADKKPLLSEEQVRWAELTVALMKMPEFNEYRQLEATMQAKALQNAFMRREGNGKTYGEQMSYNEGFYHGLVTMKSERERIWLSYLKNLKQTKGE